jgi:zinc transporter ZupT
MLSSGEPTETTTALALALLSTLVLVALHLLAPRLRRQRLLPEAAMASLAGGLAVSYVFLHLLPELTRGHLELREVFPDEEAPSPLVELGIFLVALVGFALFYGLERLAERGASQRSREARHRHPSAPSHFWVHLGAFGLYNAVITYTLPSTYRAGVAYAVMFTVAMGLHFVLTDRGLEEHYGPLFRRRSAPLVLAGALLVGWGLAVVAAPTSSLTVSLLVAFLAGSVLLNVFKEEIPSARRSSLPWFLAGLVSYAALLAGVTALG